jgi:DNA topoisomerase-1
MPPRRRRNTQTSSIDASGKKLVIVESPAKARTVGRILGDDYVVIASQGHIRDLPKSRLGVDVDNDFEPTYAVMRDRHALLDQIIEAGKTATEIFLATDPDREGEAIAWHLQESADWANLDVPPKRVVFHEITREAIEEAFQHPREINMREVDAQQARRILDRIFGFQTSSLLGRRIYRGLSAGRVQSPSLGLVVQREREIESFIPEESWTIDSILQKTDKAETTNNQLAASWYSIKGASRRTVIQTEDEAMRYESELADATFGVAEIDKRPVRRRPSAPFITSTLQQEASRKLGFDTRRTMSLAQQLYEGLDIGEDEPIGLITYMRTDSTHIADSAITETREYIREHFSEAHLPDNPRTYVTTARGAQEAHEAIRPTSVKRTPEALQDRLTVEGLPSGLFQLYKLIWDRLVASQMEDARSEATTISIYARCKTSTNVYTFRATGSVLVFPGFRSIYMEGDDNEESEEEHDLPSLSIGEPLDCLSITANQHFTKAPPRYTDAALVKAMEEHGIGRPSTYSSTVGTLREREYVERERRLAPSQIGLLVTDKLSEHFPNIVDLEFTAKMEERLDSVSLGEQEWISVVREFYEPFRTALENAHENMERVNLDEPTDEICDCTSGDRCTHTGLCGSPMVQRQGRFGTYIACSRFPECQNTHSALEKTGIPCPKPDCGGEIVERRSRRRNRAFFGCSNWPDCEFLMNDKPLPDPCPECGSLMVHSRQNSAICTSCSWEEPTTDTNDQVK